MWEPRRLTTLWASTACYRNSFTFYWAFRLCPSSGTVEAGKHNVLETGTQNYWVFRLFSLSGILEAGKHDISETGSLSETLCFLVARMPDNGKNPKTQ
jgi:hypothetical protein